MSIIKGQGRKPVQERIQSSIIWRGGGGRRKLQPGIDSGPWNKLLSKQKNHLWMVIILYLVDNYHTNEVFYWPKINCILLSRLEVRL